MKKTLVALAAAAATGAFAQSNVTLYGILDINYGTTQTTNAAGASRKTTGLAEGGLSGNRIGFRGTEDLGGGMKAGFVVETGISPTTGDIFGNRGSHSGHYDTSAATGLAAGGGNAVAGAATGTSGFTTAGASQNRQSFVSLSSSMGEVRIGYQYTNLYELASLSGYTLTTEGIAGGDAAHLAGAALVGGTRATGLTYISPKIAGAFDVRLQYGGNGANPAFDVTSGVTANNAEYGKRFGMMATYGNGPLKASAAHTTMDSSNNGAGVANPSTFDAKVTQFGASYNFGVANVAGTYTTGTEDRAAGGIAVTGSKAKAYQIGVSVPFGAVSVFAGTGKSESKNNGGAGVAGIVTSNLKTTQFGAIYTLSKRTNAYVVNGTTKEDAAAAAAGQTGAKGKSTRIGVRHMF
jgi:predicted porin